MAHPIDLHVGRRLRARRRLLNLTQEKLASAVDIRFQQIQKYESGANRISASRLWTLARALDVSVGYFFEGLNGAEASTETAMNGAAGFAEAPSSDLLDDKETISLVRYYYQLNDEPRKRLLDLAKAMSGED
ncbi:MAG: helix-turn-helix transcriptional regulator [Marinicaulis sp.]|nr:helix-turn-helix domain-containing protein [Marinicaulis sp.]NNE39697.1 helix-turn-helix transcriptional regulator [Marinicaulis sp.]NNL90356.1 helix-turn-helix transcriptional regulator [Marinicaulis sp.]